MDTRFGLLLPLFLALVAARPAIGQTPQDEIDRQVPAAMKILDGYAKTDPQPGSRKLHIVYWTPSDRDPQPAYRERLSRVLLDIQKFYASEMKRMGFGPRTIQLDLEKDGLLKIHLVKGAKPYSEYEVKSGSAIRKECLPTLKAAGLEADNETLVIFCNMSNWDPVARTMSQNSPYYAGGGMRSGTAWQVDSAMLDPVLLSKKDEKLKDGQYGNISVGKYNSIFVGGVCHELGHALGMPHNMERPDQKKAFGTALMGSGNRTYGDDRRGEGRGSFLTLAEGFRLAAHPIFSGSVKGIDLRPNAKLEEVKTAVAEDGKSFTLSAKVVADPPAYAVVGYMDPEGHDDYDATTCTAVPDANGHFTLNCNALVPGKAGVLRVVVCQSNGGRINDKALTVKYAVGTDGKVEVLR